MKADRTRKSQETIGHPSLEYLFHIIDQKLIPNCPFIRENIKADQEIFRPSVSIIKGKTVRNTPKAVEANITGVLHTIFGRYNKFALVTDLMFVNKIRFL